MDKKRESRLEEIKIKEVEVAELELNLADVEILPFVFNFKIPQQVFHDRFGVLFNTKLFEEIDRAAREFLSQRYTSGINQDFKIEPDYQKPVFLKKTDNPNANLYDVSCRYTISLDKRKPNLGNQIPFGD